MFAVEILSSEFYESILKSVIATMNANQILWQTEAKFTVYHFCSAETFMKFNSAYD
jgi:hypothetical protein